jgi:prolyl oligopeptidase
MMMRKILFHFIVVNFSMSIAMCAENPTEDQKIPDPFRWMEDIDSAETRKWVFEQSAFAESTFAAISVREAIRERLEALWDYDKIGIPYRKGGLVFFTRQTSLQNQGVLYYRMASEPEVEPTVLLDPNGLSEDGTAAISGYAINEDASLLAYGISSAGSDWQEWRVRDIATGKDLSDHLKWVKFSGASWSKDGKGFCYSRFDTPADGEGMKAENYYQKLYYHRVGDPQEKDTLLYERKDQKTWNFDGGFTQDGRYLVIEVFTGDFGKNGLFYRDLSDDRNPVVELLNKVDAEYSYVGNDGAVFYFKTSKDAPMGRLVAIDLNDPEPSTWKVILPEITNALQSVSLIGDTFVALYLKDAHSLVQLYDRTGKRMRDVDIDGPVTVGGFQGTRKDTDCYYSVDSFTQPTSIYHYDLESGKSTLYERPKVGFNPDDFEASQHFFKSKDGTRIPVFLCHKKGLKKDGQNPTYLYGYGGFNISLTPRFSLSNIAWMEMGGIYAQVNLRGGGEYGEDWHQAGSLLNKQNVFDDFQSAAEWMITEKYTSTPRLAIGGGSNGGLLVGACLTQRPELYGAAVAMVGVLDMLRFHKFTIGWAWQGEYGDVEKPEDFKNLRSYSPYHNLKKGTKYPPTLITTGDHDDRVFPAHSFKFGAALQAAQGAEENPVLVRIDIDAGHGAGKPTSKRIAELADIWAFLVQSLKMDVKKQE